VNPQVGAGLVGAEGGENRILAGAAAPFAVHVVAAWPQPAHRVA